MFSNLDASTFSSSAEFYETQFEILLTKIFACYKLMLAHNVSIPNDENEIRNVLLLRYLKNDEIRNKIDLLDYHFEREVIEDQSVGRTDIKIISQNTFLQQAAYYILECKRLDNKNTDAKHGLNSKYVENGIFRFSSEFYSCYYRVNGLIGFVVEDMDISINVEYINELLLKAENIVTTTRLSKTQFIADFEYQYFSAHFDKSNRKLKLYHIMLDLSKNVGLMSRGESIKVVTTRKRLRK